MPPAVENACPGDAEGTSSEIGTWDDTSPNLAFIAMRDIKEPNRKAAKQGFTITFTVTPPAGS